MPLENETSDTASPPSDTNQHQWALLRTNRFRPFFWTQFSGAFNDNLYKNGLILFVSFSGIVAEQHLALVNNLGALLFILPFFLFSAFAGQLADQQEKSRLIQRIKLFEIFLMGLGAVAFYFDSLSLLLLVLFLMGLQSTLFGPVKYSLLPQVLKPQELVGGNALIEMGTFLSILLGTILAGLWFEMSFARLGLSVSIVLIAVLGWLSARQIPPISPSDPDLKFDWHWIKQTKLILAFAKAERTVFLSILGVSWFWFLGAAYLTQFAQFAKITLNGNTSVVTLFTALLAIGIAAGSLSCERLSRLRLEPGIVPIGAFGLTLLGLDIGFHQYDVFIGSEKTSVLTLLSQGLGVRICLNIFALGFFGGLYIVPLYALIQQRSLEKLRSRIIAANNVINAFAMVCSALFGIIMLVGLQLSLPNFFIVLALMNLVVAIYIFTLAPEFIMRLLVWCLTNSLYRIRHTDLKNIPDSGPALLVANHVTYMDALIIAAASPRPVRFVMYKPIFDIPILSFIFRTCKAIPITSRNQDPAAYENAFTIISNMLRQGELICIFPEGKLTLDGRIDDFRPGVEKILKKDPVPVVPMALKGLWGSYFSRQQQGVLLKWPKKLFARVDLIASTPIAPEQATAERLKKIVTSLFENNQPKPD